MPTPLWSLVLAAGAGRRLASITGDVPKQFWSPDSGPTLVESTLERTAAFAPPSRTVVVVDRTHGGYVARLHRQDAAHHWIDQPCDRGTAAGVLLGLAYIAKRSPDAIVLLMPSDQGMNQTSVFNRGIQEAIEAVASGRATIVLFGVVPDRPDADYGWITPARPTCAGLAPVAGFVEKPSPEAACALFRQGSVWNTMVLVGRVAGLVELYRDHQPDLWGALIDSPYAGDLRIGHEHSLDYRSLPPADFSRDVIARATGLAVYVWPASLGWSDLGTPERLAGWYRSTPRGASVPSRVAEPEGALAPQAAVARRASPEVWSARAAER